ncbi:MAG: hypothetical protein HRT38_18910 [Alteromonadaceae bacterium]|nr:hypothetical protein [Alteromonadaceae bacterium]NQY65724.1 hypothetical protein [Alteromonadaceae bacterium]
MTKDIDEQKKLNSRHFVQVSMPEWMFQAWSDYSADIGKERRYVIETFIDDFIKSKEAYKNQKDKYVILYASPAKSKARSLWISKGHYQKVEEFAEEHSNRANRVVFTACLEGLIRNKRVEI